MPVQGRVLAAGEVMHVSSAVVQEKGPARKTLMARFSATAIESTERWAYLKDEYIVSGYSTPATKFELLLNAFHLHNETLNVWLHLVAGVVFLSLLVSWALHHDSATSGGLSTAMRDWMMSSHGTSPAPAAADAWWSLDADASTCPVVPSTAAQFLRQMLFKGDETKRELVRRAFEQEELLKAKWLESEAAFKASSEALLNGLADRALKSQVVDELRSLGSELEHIVWPTVQNAVVPAYPLLVFCFGGTVMLFSSALYHLALGFNKATYDMLCRVDLAGISFMIFGSCFPLVYYLFWCSPTHLVVYEAILGAACGATLFFCMLPAEMMHAARFYRVTAYITAASMAVVPLLHACAMDVGRLDSFSENASLLTKDYYLAYSGACYLLGVVFYAGRIPERFYPEKFDLILSSHQIWHAFVAAAAFLHYSVVVDLYHWRMEHAECPA